MRTEEFSDNVLAYEPTYDQKFETTDTGLYARRIYYNQSLRAREQEGVDEFRSWIERENL